MSYKLSLLKNALCVTHTLLDGDEAGRQAFAKAEKDANISIASCTFINCNGMTNAEFEDCYELTIYKDSILAELGVDLSSPKFQGKGKWSDRLRSVFLDQGKPFTDAICATAKYVVATAVTKNPKVSLNEHRRNSIDALVSALERMVRN